MASQRRHPERLEATVDIDRLPAREVVRRIQAEDATVAPAVAAEAEAIAGAVDAIAERLRAGGRLFYVGAGTSGRIAVLDAAELPPTFGIADDLVQVILAGGEAALRRAVEGAEDRDGEGAREVRRRVRPADAVVGISASGATPFTVGGLRAAADLGALTVAVTGEPASPLAAAARIAIAPRTGPEVVMGSTRMKAGTAQKLVLNTLSTAVMIALGRVYSNLMVDMPATNDKLRRRAAAMVEIAAGVPEAAARSALEGAAGDVRLAIVMARHGIGPGTAAGRLERAGGDLRRALEREDP